MRWCIGILVVLGAVGAVMGQTPPPLPATGPATSTAPAEVKPIDDALRGKITVFAAEDRELGETLTSLQRAAKMNMIINWRALEAAGVKRESRVWVVLREESVENALKYTLQSVGVKEGESVNYVVGDNLVEVTTTAELNRRAVLQLQGASRQLALALDEKVDTRAAREKKLLAVLLAEMKLMGETDESREVSLRGERLVVNASPRTQMALIRLLQGLLQPIKPTNVAPLPAEMKTTLGWLRTPLKEDVAAEGLRALAEKVNLSVVAHASAAEGLAKREFKWAKGERPEEKLKEMGIAYAVEPTGAMVFASPEVLALRVNTRVFDLRDIVRRRAFKAAPPKPALASLAEAEAKQAAEAAGVKTFTEYEGLLIVTGTLEQHVQIASHLEKAYKEASK